MIIKFLYAKLIDFTLFVFFCYSISCTFFNLSIFFFMYFRLFGIFSFYLFKLFCPMFNILIPFLKFAIFKKCFFIFSYILFFFVFNFCEYVLSSFFLSRKFNPVSFLRFLKKLFLHFFGML